MRFINLKKIMMVSALGLATLIGTSDVANAQTRRDIERQRERLERQRERLERQRERAERQRDRIQQRRYRIYRNGSYYQTDYRGAELLRQAVNYGYQQGFRAGQYDRRYGRRNYYYDSSIYRSGNYGYQRYVNSAQYRYYFQQGFQRGYEDGYYSRYRYGSYRNGVANILGTVLQTILNIREY